MLFGRWEVFEILRGMKCLCRIDWLLFSCHPIHFAVLYEGNVWLEILRWDDTFLTFLQGLATRNRPKPRGAMVLPSNKADTLSSAHPVISIPKDLHFSKLIFELLYLEHSAGQRTLQKEPCFASLLRLCL